MKPIFILATSLFLINQNCDAQLTIKPAIGVNFTDLSKDAGDAKVKSDVGYQIGGSVSVGKKIYFEPGIFWVEKSSKVTNVGAEDNFRFKGIRIPLAAGIKFTDNETAKIHVRGFGGLSAFFLTSADEVGGLTEDDFKSASYGVFAGAGFDFSLIFIDFSYEWSLTDIQEDTNTADVGKARSVFINAGIKIVL